MINVFWLQSSAVPIRDCFSEPLNNMFCGKSMNDRMKFKCSYHA
jgi:hypothetical protein